MASPPCAIIGALDVVVHSSIDPEPFGRVIVEAMAMARPVVASAAGGPTEIIEHGRTGFLVPPREPAILAERMLELLQDGAWQGGSGPRDSWTSSGDSRPTDMLGW